MAGNPILAMPAPRDTAKIIWVHIGRLLNPGYRAAANNNTNWGRLFKLLPPVFVAETFHGARILLEHATGIQRLIVAAFRRGPSHYRPFSERYPSDVGDVQFEEFAQRAERSVIKSAEPYDPTRGVKFSTYAYKGVRGALMDWLPSLKKTISLETPIPNTDELLLRDLIPSGDGFFGSYAPHGQKSVLPVPSDDWTAEWMVGNNLDRRPRALLDLAKAGRLSRREWIILRNIATEEVPWKDLAAAWGMSPAHLSVMITRTLKKARAAVKSAP